MTLYFMGLITGFIFAYLILDGPKNDGKKY